MTTTVASVAIHAAGAPRWWQQHGRLVLAVIPATWPTDPPFLITVRGGTRAQLDRQITRRLNRQRITRWRWA